MTTSTDGPEPHSSSHGSVTGPTADRPRRVLQVGVSYKEPCGIHAYSGILGDHLRRRGCSVETEWWERDDQGAFSGRTLGGLQDWGRRVSERTGDDVDVVLWHYSVFGYGWRGLPVFVPLAARRLARSGVPVVVVLHEFGHPWWWPGWRGSVFEVTHRLALLSVLQCASRAVVTTVERQRWIRARRWLPSVPVLFQPVFSTVETGARAPGREPARQKSATVGVFGYAAARMRPEVVVDALRILQADDRPVSLRLVGAPGPDDAGGRRWQTAASAARGSTDIAFTGTLETTELSEALSSLDVVVFPDAAGPSSRKTTLAAALAHGCCVVAIEGADTWRALVDEGAIFMAQPDPEDLADRLRTLLADDEGRRAQGARAADFYARHMAPDVMVERLWTLLFPVPQADVVTQ